MSNGIIGREDYEEPLCLLDMDGGVPEEERVISTVPVERIIKKLDSYFFSKDFDGAERHLLYWLAEARAGRDRRGELSILNELMGFYRQTGKKSEAYGSASEGLALVEKTGMEGTISAATTCLNAATVYKTFDESEKAVPLYEKAKELYEKYLPAGDGKLGGLYNNMGLALTDVGRYAEADGYYKKAIEIMENTDGGELEAAISYLNLADEVTLRLGALEAETLVSGYLDLAAALLDKKKDAKSGYYAYVCEKCATVYGYYGYFIYENELKARAESIYEGT